VFLQPEVAELGDDGAGVLARDVAGDHVAVRPRGGPGDAHDVDHGRRTLQHLQRARREVGRGNQPDVHQGDAAERRSFGHARRPGSRRWSTAGS
jgi:hypothetical protein